jgi:hypothetical protein
MFYEIPISVVYSQSPLKISFYWMPVWLLLKDPAKLAEVLKENQQQDFEVFPAGEFELAVDGFIRPPLREEDRFQVCIGVQIDKDC